MSGYDIKVEAVPPLPLSGSTAAPAWDIDAKPVFSPGSPIPQEDLSFPPKSEFELEPTPAKPAMDDEDIPKPKTGRRKTAPLPVKPVLIDHLPTARAEAHETFDELERCVYERKDLGLSREQDEMMVCDCVFDKRGSSLPLCLLMGLVLMGWDR